MADLYLLSLRLPVDRIDGKVFNAGYENHPIIELANTVREVIGNAEIEIVPTNDLRSYQVSSRKIKRELGFAPKRTIEDAVRDLKRAFDAGKLKDPMKNPLYFNIARMQEAGLR
jgi:nucleoside-diphosphate-sugar epimerase